MRTSTNRKRAVNEPWVPPWSEEAERTALGCLLLAGDEAPQMLSKLHPDHFYDLRNREILSACRCLHLEGKPITTLLLVPWLKNKGILDSVGGGGYVSALPDLVPAVTMFDHFLDLLREKASRRAALRVADELKKLALDDSIDSRALPHEARRCCGEAFPHIVTTRQWFRFRSPSECRNYDPPKGLTLAGDFHITRGSLTVLAGQPGVGKSRAAMALAVSGATGEPWFGLKIHRRFRTAILQNENGLHRLKMELSGFDVPDLDEFIRVSEPPPYGMAFDHPDFRGRLAEWLQQWQPDLVVFDPWNSAARDNGQRDYLELFNALKETLPKGDAAPALLIVAHTRKPTGDGKSGRGLINDVAGSHVLVSVPRSVFVMQHALDSTDDNHIIMTCCKNNDGALGPRTAWQVQDGRFVPCENFDWSQLDGPPEGSSPVPKGDLEKLFEGGNRRLARKQAVAELEELSGFGRTACYEALRLNGPFAANLREDEEGLLWWEA
jgi:hypothetical protein